MKSIRKSESGQAALFDALLFFVLMLLGATAALLPLSGIASVQDVEQAADMQEYAGEFSSVLFALTLNYTWYSNGNEKIVTNDNRAVLELLVEELVLLESGKSRDCFVNGTEEPIAALAMALVRPGIDFSIVASYGNSTITLSNQEEGAIPEKGDVAASVASIGMEPYGLNGKASVGLYLWRA